ncbi:MAG: uracil-DNA glycosylase [Candidatus Ozemobacteraceae bacterium]
MAKRTRKPPSDDHPAAAVDLFALLTQPGMTPAHEMTLEVEPFIQGDSGEELNAPTSLAPISSAPFAPSIPPVHSISQNSSTFPNSSPPKKSQGPQNSEPLSPAAHLSATLVNEDDPTPPSNGKIMPFPGTARRGDHVQAVEEENIVKKDSMERIRRDALQCQGCSLHVTRKNIVMGEGPENARVVLIGEAPGADEDETGRPFVGRAGQHLDKILTAAGFKREEIFICNILKDRPPDNRAPTPTEMEICTQFLSRQLAIIKPALIGLLGNTAIKHVIGPKTPGITAIHGQWFDSIFGIPAMAMYHPSYLLRYASRAVGSPNWQMWQDIQALKKRYDEL